MKSSELLLMSISNKP